MIKHISFLTVICLIQISTVSANTLFVLDNGENENTKCKASNYTPFDTAKLKLKQSVANAKLQDGKQIAKLAVLQTNGEFKVINSASSFKLGRFIKKTSRNNKHSLSTLLSKLKNQPDILLNIKKLVVYSTNNTEPTLNLINSLKSLSGNVSRLELNLYSQSEGDPISISLKHNKKVYINFFTCPDKDGIQQYKNDVYRTIASSLSKKTGVELYTITKHTRFDTDLGMDMTSTYQFQALTSERYSVNIPQINPINDINSLVTYIVNEQLKSKIVDRNGQLIKKRSVQPKKPKKAYEQTVYYATNRKADNEDNNHYSGKRQLGPNSLHYGISKVAIPKTHKVGQLSSALLGLKLFDDPKEHITIRETKILSDKQFFKNINSILGNKTITDSMKNDVVVFIHGFNVPFNKAIRRTAQVAYDTRFKGVPILFSWPSDGQVTGYLSDREDATWSVQHLVKFLDSVVAKTTSKRIHLIAHSMGNQVLIGALNQMALTRKFKNKRPFGNIIFAAPDFDAELFKYQIAPRIVSLGKSVTIYTSKKDSALNISNKLNDTKRLGLSITALPNVNLIDASNIEVSPWNVPEFHSYYATKEKVINDIVATLKGISPQNRKLTPATKDKFKYWLIEN